MTDQPLSPMGDEALLHAYSPSEQRTLRNISQCLQTKEQIVRQEDVLKELDQMVTSYNDLNVIDHRMLLQLQTLDAMFQRFVHEGCTTDSNYFKAAFIAQRLYFTTAKHLKNKSLPVPD